MAANEENNEVKLSSIQLHESAESAAVLYVKKMAADILKPIHAVLESVKKMAADILKPIRDQNYVHPYINKYAKYRAFKDCIGALDGTHVVVTVNSDDAVAYYGRKGCFTQNILAVCDFDMCFTFVSSGWEGSMHDSRIFTTVVNDPSKHFPHPKGDKYYLVDAGYANRKGFLAPYKRERYHHQLFRGAPPANDSELFNKVHSSLRSVIEMTFGVWKNRFAILKAMPSFTLNDQAAIVAGSMAIHNFIRRNTTHNEDEEFAAVEYDEDFTLERLPTEARGTNSFEDPDMNEKRNAIRARVVQIANRYS